MPRAKQPRKISISNPAAWFLSNKLDFLGGKTFQRRIEGDQINQIHLCGPTSWSMMFSGWPGKTQIHVPRQIQSESPFETWPFEGWCFPPVFGQEGTPDREPWPQLVYIFIHEPWRTSKGKLPLLLLSQNMMRRTEIFFLKLVQIIWRISFWEIR